MWENLASLLNILTDSARHFLFSGFVGLLVFALILITWHVLKKLFPQAIWMRYMDASLFILFLAALCALLAALAGHYLLDQFAAWYNTPLGPPMTIER